jgi:hypothetical protein
MTPAWAQRQAAWLRACLVSPAVFMHMVDRLCECVVPSQQAFEPEAAQRNVQRYLQGLLSHLPRTNAEDMAALVAGARLVIQEFIGTAPWEHRPLVRVLVGQGVERLGAPDGIMGIFAYPPDKVYSSDYSVVVHEAEGIRRYRYTLTLERP